MHKASTVLAFLQPSVRLLSAHLVERKAADVLPSSMFSLKYDNRNLHPVRTCDTIMGRAVSKDQIFVTGNCARITDGTLSRFIIVRTFGPQTLRSPVFFSSSSKSQLKKRVTMLHSANGDENHGIG
jgi:hypothetical protein